MADRPAEFRDVVVARTFVGVDAVNPKRLCGPAVDEAERVSRRARGRRDAAQGGRPEADRPQARSLAGWGWLPLGELLFTSVVCGVLAA